MLNIQMEKPLSTKTQTKGDTKQSSKGYSNELKLAIEKRKY